MTYLPTTLAPIAFYSIEFYSKKTFSTGTQMCCFVTHGLWETASSILDLNLHFKAKPKEGMCEGLRGS